MFSAISSNSFVIAQVGIAAVVWFLLQISAAVMVLPAMSPATIVASVMSVELTVPSRIIVEVTLSVSPVVTSVPVRLGIVTTVSAAGSPVKARLFSKPLTVAPS